MIIDKIENLFKYINMNPLFADVVKFLESNDLNTLEEGKHEIKGTDLFVNVQAKPGKKLQDAVLEYHKKMIDIQIPVSDSETFGYTPVDELPEVEFDEQKDIAKLPGLEAQTYVTINPGQMAIFFPQDGHAPCISESGCLRKVIFKILA
ncbi:MAG: YhcH/YjgK/YiaL family protein [Prevotella sp.]|jgi:YhcH/YjgK/YiaL family protein|nr:YhcH/YjgK/YiaL family protein [Prevotella sp.]